MRELNEILAKCAKDWTWKGLDKHLLVRIIKQVCEALGVRLSKRMLAKIVPVVGGVVGAGVNWAFLADLAEAARNVYGKRFLYDKYRLDGPRNNGRKTR